MKKTYIAPTLVNVEVLAEGLIASSITSMPMRESENESEKIISSDDFATQEFNGNSWFDAE